MFLEIRKIIMYKPMQSRKINLICNKCHKNYLQICFKLIKK